MVERIQSESVEGSAQGLDRLVEDMRRMLADSTVEQVRQEFTGRLLEALQDDRERARYVVGLLVEAALRQAQQP